MGYCSWVDAGLARLTERLEKVNFWPLSPHGEEELMMMLMMMVKIIFSGWLVGGNRPLARDIVLYPWARHFTLTVSLSQHGSV